MNLLLKKHDTILLVSSSTWKVILFFLISLSVSNAFAQPKSIRAKGSDILTASSYSSDLLEEGYSDSDTYPYDYNGTSTYTWKVAEHIHSLWTIWAIDVVDADILTGITASNLAVVREGITLGDLIVTARTGYGVRSGSGSVTVGIACTQSLNFPGFPSLNGSYLKLHVYKF